MSSLLDHGIGIGMIGLSATMDDYEKWKLLKIIGFEKQHKVTYTTDQGVDDGILPDYEVWAYLVRMEDKVRREMPPFFKNPITEARAYSWVNKKLGEAMYSDEKNLEKKEKQIKFWTIRRYQIIQSLHSKEKAVKFMINRIPEGKQLIVFCGNIKQANRLCPNAYHSKSEGFELQRCRDGHINQLSVVGMLD